MNPRYRLTPVAALLLTAGLAGPHLAAYAQSTAAQAAPAGEAPQDAATPGKVQEVVVTAQKIKQLASKTPLALTVVGGEELKSLGVVDVRSLGDLAPSVQIGQESGKAQIAIRGVTSLDMTEKGDPSTAFHVDGAYVARPEAQLGAFYDLDRIEVLRGPQGTLYGRNATAGAINLITAKPKGKFEGRLGFEGGNYGTVRADGMINVPLNDTFSLRAAVNTNTRDSYVNPGANTVPMEKQDDRAARVSLLGNFGKDTSLLLTAETFHAGGHTQSPVPIGNFFTGTWIDSLPFSPPNTGNNIQNPVYVDRGVNAQRTATWLFKDTADAHRNNEHNSLRAELNTGIGFADLSYQLAHQTGSVNEQFNGVYFGFPLTSDIDGESSSTSHELRLSSNGTGPWKWVAGIYAFDEKIHQVSAYNTYITAPFGSFVVNVPFDATVKNQSQAAFGQLTYSVMPDLRLTAGLRQTHDKKTGVDTLGGTPDASGAYATGVEFDNTSWKLGVEKDLGRQVMAFGSVATGYKAGGFNDRSDGGNYEPEQLTSYEAGIKGRFLDGALQLSLSAFHYDYRDLQVNSVVCTGDDVSTCGSLTTNAARANVNGVEAEGKWAVFDNGTVKFGLSLLEAKFKDYHPTDTVDFSGQRLDRAPAQTVSLGYSHTFELAGGGEWLASIGTRHSSSYMVSDPAAGIRYTQPSFHKSDASLTYAWPRAQYTAQLFVKNIENETTIESRVPGSFFLGDPRTWGVRFSARF